jgi:hypothetical protein
MPPLRIHLGIGISSGKGSLGIRFHFARFPFYLQALLGAALRPNSPCH